MKYELDLKDTKKVEGKTLYRIVALKNFSDIKKSDKGGYIEKESNLSQNGNCWVYDNAYIFGNAEVYGNTKIYDKVIIKGNAKVFENTVIYDNAIICENATVCGNIWLYDNVIIKGNAIIKGNVIIRGQAIVRDNAIIYGKIAIKGDAVISEHQRVTSGTVTTDLSKNLTESIRCQTGLLPINNKVIAYKQVRKDLTSFYDNSFQYKIGEFVEVEDYDTSNKSCTTGLHFSNSNYWNSFENIQDSTFIAAEISLDDIITVQEGKIRCKRAFILGQYNI